MSQKIVMYGGNTMDFSFTHISCWLAVPLRLSSIVMGKMVNQINTTEFGNQCWELGRGNSNTEEAQHSTLARRYKGKTPTASKKSANLILPFFYLFHLNILFLIPSRSSWSRYRSPIFVFDSYTFF